jgi:NAD(P)H dehydrogenase (quinone)
MTRVLVLYYSAWGHIESMAHAVAEGASQAGASVSIRRVPDIVPLSVAERDGHLIDQSAPLAHIDELADFDAIIIGTPTRFGSMAAPMRAFLERAGGLWSRNALVGKVGAIFTTSGTQHGGQETTILTAMPTLFHLGMIVVGLPYTFAGQSGLDEIKGGSPLWRRSDRRQRRRADANCGRTRGRTLPRPSRGHGRLPPRSQARRLNLVAEISISATLN